MQVDTFQHYYGTRQVGGTVLHDLTVRAELSEPCDGQSLLYLAARPADRRASFSGSMLPFPTESAAMSETPNAGAAVAGPDGAFTINMLFPNSYYRGMRFVEPTLFVYYTSRGREVVTSVKVGDAVPHRDLVPPSDRRGCEFYHPPFHYPVRTQAQILLDSAYSERPSDRSGKPVSFWGGKPAV
jgi:hypothetical protein